MVAWLVQNAATLIISAVLLVIVGLIVRGMARGKIKSCSDCGSAGGGCTACQFADQCQSAAKGGERP